MKKTLFLVITSLAVAFLLNNPRNIVRTRTSAKLFLGEKKEKMAVDEVGGT
ncbi:MAG: hypothetical protein ACXADX_17645 [Candidatus Hodarchaeales archaeon]|jgi:hypothetical protein